MALSRDYTTGHSKLLNYVRSMSFRPTRIIDRSSAADQVLALRLKSSKSP